MKHQSLRSLIVLGLSVGLFTQQLRAQTTPPDINPPEVAATTDVSLTPNVTGTNISIGNIYSPNLFDGSANIVVPIYQYKNDYGDYGISFSYNTKGVKVDEVASPVGLHWQLNAGGGISRVLKDAPDEIDDYVGSYTGTQVPPKAEIKGKWYDIFGATSPAEAPYSDRVYRDGEFDDFVVSAGSLNFTFNLGKNGYIFTHPNRRIKIEMLVDGTPVTQLPHTSSVSNYIDLSFHITDEQGTQYWFSKDNAQEWDLWDGKTVGSEKVATYNYNAHWVLDKVIFPNGQSISYNYDQVAVNYNLYGNAVSLERDGVAPVNSANDLSESTTVEEISSIKYPNGVTVDFVYGTGRCDASDNILQSIKVSAGSKSINYVMQQKYYAAPHSNCSPPVEIALGNCNITTIYGCTGGVSPNAQRYLRLRLKGIRIQSSDGSYSEPYYTFSYDSTRLPPRLTASQDYFGYYNGVAIANSADEEKTVPYHTPLSGLGSAYGIVRSYDASKAKAGLLTKITNAYGGSDSFIYGAHILLNVNGMPVPAASDFLFMGNEPDGVQLQKVIETDPYYTGNYSQTTFTYGGGQYFIPGGYFHYPRAMSSGASPAANSWYFTGIYVSPHQFINGSNHGYSNVTIESRDQAGNLLSKKINTFTNFSDATSGNQPRYHLAGDNKDYYQYPFANRQYIKDWELGLPLETKTYDQNNRIVSDVANTYSFATDDNSSAGKVENEKIFRVQQAPGSTADTTWYRRYYKMDSAFYHPYTGTALLSQTISKKYVSDASFVADTISYTYDSRHNLIATTASNSKGEKTVLRTIYNYNVCGPDVPAETPPLTNAILNSMSQDGLEKVVSMERWKTVGSGGASDKLLDASITQYQYQGGHLYTKGLYTYQTGSPVIRSTYQGFANPTSALNNPYHNVINAYNSSAAPASYYQEASKVTSFDAKGNPLENQLLGQNQYKAMLWDTVGNKIAEAANAKNTDIAFTSFEGGQVRTSALVEGNFSWLAANTMSGSAVTGGKYFKLSGSQQLTWTVGSPNKKYIITFWSKSGIPTVSGPGFASVSFTNTYSLASGWKFYTGECTPTAAGTLAFSASAVMYLDEVRICPADAQIQSWTYDPLFGAGTASDPRGRVTYYEYDSLGRLHLVKDQDGNIQSMTNYHVN